MTGHDYTAILTFAIIVRWIYVTYQKNKEHILTFDGWREEIHTFLFNPYMKKGSVLLLKISAIIAVLWVFIIYCQYLELQNKVY